jgi:hypothetical protein
MSWKMMLRSMSGYIFYKVVEKETKERLFVKINDFLIHKQRKRLATHPDMIWQFAQHLKSYYEERGREISVYANARVSLNGRKKRPLVDKTVDLAAVNWNYCSTQPWITEFSFEESPGER